LFITSRTIVCGGMADRCGLQEVTHATPHHLAIRCPVCEKPQGIAKGFIRCSSLLVFAWLLLRGFVNFLDAVFFNRIVMVCFIAFLNRFVSAMDQV
jgi:hypothetical protein